MTHPDPQDSSTTVPTGVPGFDEVLGGGLGRGGLYLIEGRAGAGKTILASQIAFNRAARGDTVIYLTVLAESHGKLLDHMRRLAFFDEQVIPSRIQILSGYQSLLDEGLDGLLRQIFSLINEESPALLIIDGFRTATAFAENEKLLARFMHQLDDIVSGARCTTLLLSPLESVQPRPEHTLVDGLIEVSLETRGLRRARLLEVRKFRGAAHLRGRHLFRINHEGIRVFPRLEARFNADVHTPVARSVQVATGIPVLDEMMGGGVLVGSTTAVLGATGAGKTILGLSFLEAGLRAGEPAIYFGFYEDPERLLAKAEGVGIALRDRVASGQLVVHWQPTLELVTDELCERMLQQVESSGARRLFIDGIEGFRDSSTFPERFRMTVTALTVFLRAAGVTTYFSQELPLGGGEASLLDEIRMSAVTENILLLRHTVIRSRLRRQMSIIKMRDNAHDHDVHEFTIYDRGFDIGPRFQPDHEDPAAAPRGSASGGQ